jgi:hypothetical protein
VGGSIWGFKGNKAKLIPTLRYRLS